MFWFSVKSWQCTGVGSTQKQKTKTLTDSRLVGDTFPLRGDKTAGQRVLNNRASSRSASHGRTSKGVALNATKRIKDGKHINWG